MSNDKTPLHHIITDPTKGVEKSIKEDEEIFRQRQRTLERTAPNMDAPGKDNYVLPPNQRHTFTTEGAAKLKNFDQKIYLFPPSYNALREELETWYPTFFTTVNPEVGCSPAWAMVYDAAQFIGLCNGAFDLAIQMDSENVDGICKEILNAARKLRGVAPYVY